MSEFSVPSPENPRLGERDVSYIYRELVPVHSLAQTGIYSTPPPYNYITQPTTTPVPHLTTNLSQSTTSPPTDVTAPNPVVDALRAELNAKTIVNNNLAASVARLQAELNATISVNKHLAASVAGFQAEQALPTTPTPASTATASPDTGAPDTAITPPPTTTLLPCSHPDHPRTIASGRGAGSPEVFQEMIKTNWHGRLGRAHMVDVDALPAAALTELDCLLRRKLHLIYPRGGDKTWPSTDKIFATLSALGLRLEDRGAYADLPVILDKSILCNAPTIKRGRNSASWYITKGAFADYWEGVVLETLVELARYRGLFDDEGYLKEA